jgi:hypothetical protein
MSEYHNRDLLALDQVEDLLAAYAEARLAPSGPVLARMRRQFLAEAATAAATTRLAGNAPSRAGWRSSLSVRLPSRAFAIAMAAMLTLGAGAAVLAAPPGSALYSARVAIETALLPVQADARLAAHEEHLAQRLADAEAAAASGNAASLVAALAAYQAELDAAIADVGDDAARLAHLEAMLARHVATLTALEASVPEQASVDKALENSQKAVEKIREAAGKPAGRPTDAPAGPAGEPGKP